ncbi:MAG: ABC transporter permease [Bacteroidota bacterium]|nr:ABC transporter permease [Bacteroidota bacterium]
MKQLLGFYEDIETNFLYTNMSIEIKVKDKVNKKKENYLSENSFGKPLKAFFEEITLLTKFTFRFFKEVVKPPYEFNEFVKQSYLIGYKSFPLVAITGLIMGLVLTIQSRPTLAQFGAESWLPAMVAVSIVREIGPVITALIFAGKVGSGIGAELASMKVTEQIDAMEVSGINPFKYLVVTRIVSATFMLPILVVAANAISLYGAYIGVNIEGNVSFLLFFSQVFEKLSFTDVFPAIIKTFFFGFAVALISCYKGYNSNKGTEGVGKAANSAVVFSSLLIFILDMVAVQLTSLFSK